MPRSGTSDEIEPDRRQTAMVERQSQGYLLVALMLTMMLCGWAEGSTGPLLPPLQQYYQISYTKLSLFWAGGFVGGITAGFSNIALSHRLGFSTLAPLGGLLQAIGYAIQAIGVPFPVFVGAASLLGFGLTLQDAQINNMASRLHLSSSVSIVQACFSIGATIGPFFSTEFSKRYPDSAYRFFWIPSMVAFFVTLQMIHASRGITEKTWGQSASETQDEEQSEHPQNLSETSALLVKAPEALSGSGRVWHLAKDPAVMTVVLWAFIYNGLEVTVSTYITAYLIAMRGGSLSSGFATTAFWAAMSISRLAGGPISAKLGYPRAMMIYSFIAALALGCIGTVNSKWINVAAVVVCGLIFGPMYPNALMMVSIKLDDEMRGGIMGLMGSLGGAGGAMLPILASKGFDQWGFWTLVPMGLSLTVLQVIVFIWFSQMKVPK